MKKKTVVDVATCLVAYALVCAAYPAVRSLVRAHVSYVGGEPIRLPVFGILIMILSITVSMTERWTKLSSEAGVALAILAVCLGIFEPHCEGDLPLLIGWLLVCLGRTGNQLELKRTGYCLIAIFIAILASPSPFGTPYLAFH